MDSTTVFPTRKWLMDKVDELENKVIDLNLSKEMSDMLVHKLQSENKKLKETVSGCLECDDFCGG
jgi:hypothetical protein